MNQIAWFDIRIDLIRDLWESDDVTNRFGVFGLCLCRALCFLAFAATLAAVLCLVLRIPEPQTYDFENLLLRPLGGQDNWRALRDPLDNARLRVDRVPGSNRSKILTRDWWGPDINRENDRAFSFRPFSGFERDAVLQFDIRYGGARGPSADGYFFTGGEGFGLGNNHFTILIAGHLTKTAPMPTRVSEGDWLRLQLRIDFTAHQGYGSGDLFYADLTAGDSDFLPVEGLQGVKLAVGRGRAAEWKKLHINIGAPDARIAVDNLVPNMASSSYKFEKALALCAILFGLSLAGAIALRRQRT